MLSPQEQSPFGFEALASTVQFLTCHLDLKKT